MSRSWSWIKKLNLLKIISPSNSHFKQTFNCRSHKRLNHLLNSHQLINNWKREEEKISDLTVLITHFMSCLAVVYSNGYSTFNCFVPKQSIIARKEMGTIRRNWKDSFNFPKTLTAHNWWIIMPHLYLSLGLVQFLWISTKKSEKQNGNNSMK